MEFFVEYKDQVLQILTYITLPVLVMFISLSFVYIFGRMLDIAKTERAKNAIALFVICSSYAFYFCTLENLPLVNKIWSGLIYGALSIIFYVTIGFKFFNRIDYILDKLAPDTTEQKEIKKARASKKKK